MDSSNQTNPSRFRNLNPTQAAELLRRRLMILGGVVGGAMGLLWSFLAALLFKPYPSLGSAPFLILTFISFVFLCGSGILVGRYFYTKIMAKK